MTRTPIQDPDGRRPWRAELAEAQQAVTAAERHRDEIARLALADGFGVRGTAAALGVDKSTIVRRYGRRSTR